MNEYKKFTGGCLCGSIRYEAVQPVLGSFVCYCQMCQRASGSAFAALFYVEDTNLRITKGSPHVYTSSPGVERSFCSCCGSPLFFRRANRPGQCAIMVGSLDNPKDFSPQMCIFVSDKAPWLEQLSGIDSYAEKPAGMSPPLPYNPVTGQIKN